MILLQPQNAGTDIIIIIQLHTHTHTNSRYGKQQ